jgi:tetratricopeptide (TPR) repeat protein
VSWWLARVLPHRPALVNDLRLATLLAFVVSAQGFEEFMPLGEYLAEIIQLVEGCSDKLLQSFSWYLLAVTVSYISSIDSRVEHLERALTLALAAEIAQKPGAEFGCLADRDWILANTLKDHARYLLDHKGDIARAVSLTAEALDLCRARGDHDGIVDSLGILGRVALVQGALAQAYTYFHEAVSVATDFNCYLRLGDYQPYLALVALYGGDGAEARRLLHASLRHCLRLKDRYYISRVYTCLAETALREEELDEAAQWLSQSLTYDADPHRLEIYLVRRLFIAGCLATAQNRYLRAATIFGLADQLHRMVQYVIVGPMRAPADEALATLQAALDPAIFDEAFNTGQQLSLAEAFASILAPVHIAPTLSNPQGQS